MPAVVPHSYSPSSHYLYPQFVHVHSERLRHGNLLTHRILKIPPFPPRKKNVGWLKNLQPQCLSIQLLLLLYRRDRNVVKKETEKILKYKDFTTEVIAHAKYKNKSDTRNNRGKWNHLRITQTIPEKHNGKA